MERSPIDGLLVLDKPAGWTSHDVVARVRRLTGERHTGHAGTLDPLATGVLPLGLGQGTRVLAYLSESGKEYRATIRLGATTDTFDAEGQVTSTASSAGVTRETIETALVRFRGTFEQRPPLYSAVKRAGRPLYRYARAGLAVDIPTRPAHVQRLALVFYDPPDLSLEIECASGFYVRSLAHDLGQALGCGAYLLTLRRTRVGPLGEDDAITLDALGEAVQSGRLFEALHSLDAPLRQRPAIILATEHAADVSHGKPLHLGHAARCEQGAICRAYSTTGELLAVMQLEDGGVVRPLRVFPEGRRGPNMEYPFMPIGGIP